VGQQQGVVPDDLVEIAFQHAVEPAGPISGAFPRDSEFPVARIPRIELVAIAVDALVLSPIAYLAAVIARNDGLRKTR
jgi:hypothetical protein